MVRLLSIFLLSAVACSNAATVRKVDRNANQKVRRSGECYVVGTWWPNETCEKNDAPICDRGWGTYATESACCQETFGKECSSSGGESGGTNSAKVVAGVPSTSKKVDVTDPTKKQADPEPDPEPIPEQPKINNGPTSGIAGDTGFERTVTPEHLLVMFSDWGLNYPKKGNPKTGMDAAKQLHRDIVDAIKLKPSVFGDFLNSDDINVNRREAASFFANVRKETGGFSAMEEVGTSPGTYCSSHPSSGASDQLKEAGAQYPCNPQKGYHGRGAIQLTWNFNYAKFSDFLYGNEKILLDDPDLVIPDGPTGWAASLWFWMTEQSYGGACPPKQHDSFLDQGKESCHHAMGKNGQGMGKTINIINGDFCGILDCESPHPSCHSSWSQCDLFDGCPLVSENKDRACDAV
eukprot:Awhi_evm1s13362